jgi:S1-C subfamily serine protease
VLAAILAGLILVGGGAGIGWGLAREFGGMSSLVPSSSTSAGSSSQHQSPLEPQPQSGSSSSSSLNLQAIANEVDPAVVDIDTTLSSNGLGPAGTAAGTGMILTPSGEVMTNNHVIEGATSIQVAIEGDGTHSATVLGVDPNADVALLQVNGVSGLPTVHLANSSTLSVGEAVAAIGNALGEGGTPRATSGTIEALHQSISVSGDDGTTENLSDMIEMDATIWEGDSGGALVNSSGQVVGMLTAGETAGFRQTSGSIQGYAIPTNDALSVVNQIRSGQASSQVLIGPVGYLGVEVQNLNGIAAAQLGLDINSGALVVGLVPGGPAAQAGIPQDSVITAINGQTVTDTDQLGTLLHQHKPGQQVQVTWVDQSGTHTTTATLTTGPPV